MVQSPPSGLQDPLSADASTKNLDGLSDANSKIVAKWRRNFMLMAIFFSVGEATVTTPIGYATTLLDPKLGAISTGSGMLWVAVACLVAGPFAVKSLGAKQTLVIGMALDAAFATLFAVATQFPKGGPAQWAIMMVAPLCSGFGVGMIWTAQGSFFSATVALVVDWSRKPKPRRTDRRKTLPTIGAIVSEELSEEQVPESCRSLSAPTHAPAPVAATSRRRRSITVGDTVDLKKFRNKQWWLARAQGMSSGGWAASGMVFTDPASLQIPGPEEEQEKEEEGDESVQLDKPTATAMLGSMFAALFLATDVLMKMSVSLLQGSIFSLEFHDPFVAVFPMFVGFAALSVAMVFAISLLKDPEQGELPASLQRLTSGAGSGRCCDRMKGAIRLWPLPELWCFGLTTLTFGLCGGYMNGYVNGLLTANNSKLGPASIGGLMALSSVVAAVLSLLFGPLAARVGKGPIVLFGAVSFAIIPLAVLVGSPSEDNDYWGAGLMSLYVVQGLGRAVYESTNKAVFADHFPGSQSAGVFANVMMMNGFSFFLSSVLQSAMPIVVLMAVIVVFAALTPAGYLFATWSHARRARGRLSSSAGASLQPVLEGS